MLQEEALEPVSGKDQDFKDALEARILGGGTNVRQGPEGAKYEQSAGGDAEMSAGAVREKRLRRMFL